MQHCPVDFTSSIATLASQQARALVLPPVQQQNWFPRAAWGPCKFNKLTEPAYDQSVKKKGVLCWLLHPTTPNAFLRIKPDPPRKTFCRSRAYSESSARWWCLAIREAFLFRHLSPYGAKFSPNQTEHLDQVVVNVPIRKNVFLDPDRAELHSRKNRQIMTTFSVEGSLVSVQILTSSSAKCALLKNWKPVLASCFYKLIFSSSRVHIWSRKSSRKVSRRISIPDLDGWR